MPPRRTHTKSRAGCGNCKQRRIKCDEVHPRCGNCTKHGIGCDFSTGVGSERGGDARAVVRDGVGREGGRRDGGTREGGGEKREINMVDMELLHHWTLAVPSSMGAGEEVVNLWRDAVPRLAFRDGGSGGGLMHAVLATSALHLGVVEGGEGRDGRLRVAAEHYGEAVRAVKESVSVPGGITRANCEGLFVSAALIVVYAVASPMALETSEAETEWVVPAWLPLIRGMHSILKEVWEWISGGSLAPMFAGHGSIDESLSEDPALEALFRICTDRREEDADEIKESSTSSTYFAAIHELQKSFTNPALRSNLVSLIFVWPISVGEGYIALLQEQRPRALVIFAYYCVLLKKLEGVWWVQGRAAYELDRIEQSLSENWKKWLEWPVKMIRG